MTCTHRSWFFQLGLSVATILCVTAPAGAVDGVVLIDQNRALAGSVTPGDAPGFPVTITRPGSYRLSGNLTIVDPDMTAVEITADNVTLDLNGFTIQGPADQCSGSLVPVWCSTLTVGFGVYASKLGTLDDLRESVTVRNGTVRAMGQSGIVIGERGRVEQVTVEDNRSDGVICGVGAIVSSNIIVANRRWGINAGRCLVTGNTLIDNLREGVAGIVGTPVLSNNFFDGNNSSGSQIYGTFVDAGGNVCDTGPCP